MTKPLDPVGDLSPLRRAFVALEEMQAKLARVEGARIEPLAVIGIGCRFPGGANDPEAFWRLLRDGVDAISEVPRERWDVDACYDPDPATPGRTATRWGAFIENVDRFDAAFFGISPREAVAMDPQHRLLLEVAWEALESAGQAPDRLSGSRTGVYVGIASMDYAQRLLAQPTRIDAYYASGNGHSMAAGRLSYLLGLQGPSLTIDTACSSSLVAVHLACQSLRSGECRMAVAGGVHLTLSPENTIAFSKARMLAPDGRCKTFDAGADGFSEGEGCGVVVLKRLSDALADGDRVLAVVRGTAVNQDGPSAGLTAPSGPAQEAVIREALANGGVAPHDVAYVEAHGTGTSLGDPIEVRAIASVLAAGRADDRPLLLGSAKASIGHLEAAAGVAGLLKVVLSLQHGEIPPQLHFRIPNPHVAWNELAVEVVTTRRPWPAGRHIAGVSSFGFSGTNAHLIVEAAPAVAPTTAPSTPGRPVHVLTLAAKSEAALDELASRYDGALEASDASFADICFTAATGRASFEHRVAVVGATAAEARVGLASRATSASSARVVLGHVHPGARHPRVAFLFSGQGAQYAGMGRGLYEGEGVFRAAVQRCAGALGGAWGPGLEAVVYGAEAGEWVDETAYTQVALFAVEWGLAEVWRAWGVRPSVVVGHSVGEYVAACVAGVLEVEEAVRVVAARGRLMGALPRGGAMVAVGAGEGVVREVLRGVAGVVGIAAVNGPESVVVSGAEGAVGGVVRELEGRGIRSQRLRVSHAFHSGLMEPMQEAFGAALAGVRWRAPQVTMVSTVTGAVVGAGEVEGAGYWVRQVREPVRYAAAMETVAAMAVDAFVEAGPGVTLLGLGRRCVGEDRGLWVPSLRHNRSDWEQMLEGLAALWAQGVEVDWAAFDRGQPRKRVALPTYPFQRERFWVAAVPASGPHGTVAAAHRATPVAHPLLARRLSSPLPSLQFETELSAQAPGFLDQHRIDGVVVLPATAYIEMIGAAAQAHGLDAHRIEDVTLQEALVIPDRDERTVQIVLTPESGGALAARVFSLEGNGADGRPRWRVHVTGRVVPDDTVAEPSPTLAEAQAECDESLSAEAFYARIDGRALDLGASFRGVQEVRRTDGAAVARVVLPADVTDEARYRLHPVLLDACVQVIAAALPAEAAVGHIYLPMAIDRFRLIGRPGRQVWSLVRLTSSPGGDTLSADLSVLDEAGKPIAEMLGLRLKRATRGISRRLSPSISEWLHEVVWQPAPLLTVPAGGEDLSGRLAEEVERWTAQPKLARYEDAMRGLDGLSVAYIVAALGALGHDLRAGQAVSEESLTEALGVLPGYRRLLGRWLEILVEEGLLRPSSGGLTVVRTPTPVDVDELARELDGHGDVVRGELAFLRQCGPRLADVLRGKCDPLELLFPDGSRDSADHLYHDSPIAHVSGALVRETVLSTLSRLPQERRIRILEVGGGTGGTTAAVLRALPSERAEYVFTDISPSFVARARERFAAYPFFQARPLDIETEPTSPERFDVIIAANVIHATADLRRTLDHCRQRLAPDGVLVLVEVTVPQRWIDLTFGLTDGWWKFSDDDLRPRYPLLGRNQWIGLLERCGFSGVTAVPEPGSVGRALGQQAVIAATRSTETVLDGSPRAAGPWVVLADHTGIGDRLIAGLRAHGESCVVVRRAVDGRTPDDGALTADPLEAEQVKRALRDAVPDPGMRPRGIVYLWALDAPDDLGVAVEQGAPLQGVSGALHLIQALPDATERGARLWLVTRGAQRLAMDPTAPGAAQAPLWGLGRTVLQEHPELNCVCVDLDPSATADAGDALLSEILAPEDGEEQVAWRGAQRHAARLVRWHERPRDPSKGPARIEKSKQGSLEGLSLRPVSRQAPGPGEVEIAVRASALNFKDVLNALDMYPGDAGPLGSECAGTVVAVGSDVASVRAGDHVVALAPGSLATTVIARADLVVPKPARLTFEQAASLSVAFVTAAYALSTVGGLRAGERVLIHAAAGGVGLAAVRLAHQRGAEVLATAGSAEKREFLRSQGVAHVFDSRSLEFQAGIMAATGGQGVDVVLNSLSGDAIEASLSVVAPGGRFLEIGKRGIWAMEDVARRRPDIAYTIIDWTDVASLAPGIVRQHMIEILAAVETGDLSPLPITAFRIDDATAAFRFMAQARHRGKIVLVHPEARSEDAALPVRSDGTYLVTGGLGGLGLEVARWLVRGGARSLVLMGRRAPSVEAMSVIAELESAGAEVSVARGDVASRAQVEHAVAAIGGTRPPLRGVIHAAGVLDEGVLMQQDVRKFARVMAAKVEGAWNLECATRHLPLDLFVLFSSVAGVFGSPGQANHAAANAFLDAFAHHRRARGLPAMSIDWGAWADVGAAVEEEALRRIARQGIGRMRPDDALSALEAVLADGAVQVVVASVNWTAFLARMPGGRVPSLLRDTERRTRAAGQTTMASPPAEGRFLAGLNAAAASKRHVLLRDHIAERIRRVLGLDASQTIDPLRPLKEMGIDSLMAVELRNLLKTDLGLDGGLPATLVFDYPTVDGIAHYLAREVLGFEADAALVGASAPAPGAVLSRVEQMTDEEVDRLLGERLGSGDS